MPPSIVLAALTNTVRDVAPIGEHPTQGAP